MQKDKYKRIVTLVMATALLVTSVPSLPVSFAATEEIHDSIENATESAAFEQSYQLGDAVITVTAPEGVFPAGSILQVKEVNDADAETVYDAVEEMQAEDMSEVQKSAKDYLYDIKVIFNGEEIEPNIEFGNANISFSLLNAPANVTGAEIYHISGDIVDVSATVSEAATESETATDSEIATESETASDSIRATDSETATGSDSAQDKGSDEEEIDEDYENCIKDEIIDIGEIGSSAEENDLYIERLTDVSVENDSENGVTTVSAGCESFSIFLVKLMTVEPGKTHMEFDSKGHALPIVQNSVIKTSDDYFNQNVDVYRFCVYVETDHDTDGDGYNDLVKVFLQVPRAAVNGGYKAPVIFEAMPYSAGTIEGVGNAKSRGYKSDGFDLNSIYEKGDYREDLDYITTSEFALGKGNNYKDWYYSLPVGANNKQKAYGGRSRYAYYLERGFAIAVASGIGTAGSEGFELCGLDLERDAIKCVVEWLAGKSDRDAYTDKDNIYGSTNRIKAEWSNNKIAMAGQSYGGTLPFEVACTGVNGLETIIPFAGIASWYDYTNSQGMHMRTDASYTDHLSLYNSGGCYEDSDWRVHKEDYKRYLGYISEQETEADGNYTWIWEKMDYTKEANNIKCSGLIFHGTNDFNVTTKHADMMYQSFLQAGAEVRMIMHQGAHQSPYDFWFLNNKNEYENSSEMINRWLCYYLLDITEDVEIDTETGLVVQTGAGDQKVENTILKDLSQVTWQDSVDPLIWHSEDEWRNAQNTFNYRQFDYTAPLIERDVITEDYEKYFTQYWNEHGASIKTVYYTDRDPYYEGIPEEYSARYKILFDNVGNKATEILGSPKISIRVKTPMIKEMPIMSAVLIDRADNGESYWGCVHEGRYQGIETTPATMLEETHKTYLLKDTTANVISKGWIDLENPVDYDESEDRKSYATNLENRRPFTWYDYTIDMTPVAYTVAPGHHLELVLYPWDPFSISVKRPEEEISDQETADYENAQADSSYEEEEIDYDDLVYDRYMFTIDVESAKINLPLTAASSQNQYTSFDEKLDLNVDVVEQLDAARHYRVYVNDSEGREISDNLKLELKYESGDHAGEVVDVDDYNAYQIDNYFELYIFKTIDEAFLAEGHGCVDFGIYVKDNDAKIYGKEGLVHYIPHVHKPGEYFEEIPATETTTGLKAHYLCMYECGAWLDIWGIERDPSYFIIEKGVKSSGGSSGSGKASSDSMGKLETSNGKKRFRKSDGSYATNEWARIDGKWYYFGADSYACTGWLLDDGHWYYLRQDGVMTTGWQQDGDKWYYLKPNGDMAIGWVQDDKGNWYYMNPVANGYQGMMLVGWMTDPVTGYKYYLDSKTGKMVTGTVVIDGKTYEFTSNPGEGRPIGALK